MDDINILSQIITTTDVNTQNIEDFLSVQNTAARAFRETTKYLYDFTKINSNHKNNALPELVIQDFDEEQIWQQLEIQNESELTYFLTEVSRVLSKNNNMVLPLSLTKADEKLHDEEEEEEEELNLKKNQSSDSEKSDSDEEMDLDFDFDEIPKNKKKSNKVKTSKRHKKSSIVDDKFFKLQDLDEYLNREDKNESKVRNDDSDVESLDLFQNDSEDEDDVENARMLKYADFFDSPASEDENNPKKEEDADELEDTEEEEDKEEEEEMDEKLEDEEEENHFDHNLDVSDESDKNEEKTNKKNKKYVTFASIPDSIDKIESGDDRNKIKSTLESRQERLQKRIEELEREAISEKPWQLKGEVSGPNRPQNSLLEEFVEFDITTRPPPVITEETTLQLEDIIKQRIKDEAWDDVQRKFKPVETPMEYKKKLVMDQEKSKKSLAQIYEEAYLKQKEALDPASQEKEEEEPKEHKEIRGLMESLFKKLDALSNYHYTPKMAQPDFKIISNVPAFTMEEVAPVATADSALLAPEEVRAKQRGDLIGKSERTKTDKKRERRKKKTLQRKKFKAKEQKEMSLHDKLKKNKKQEKMAQDSMLKKLTKDRNIKKIDETNYKAVKSSTAFFNQLQDEVTGHIKSKINKIKKKKENSTKSAAKFKL